MNEVSNSKELRLQPFVLAGEQGMVAEADHDANHYKGLRIFSLPGLHEFVTRILKEEGRSGSVLDIAAGTGAMSAHCRDLGFEVTATDALAGNFKAPDVPFHEADLDAHDWLIPGAPFDNILAVEII